MFFMEPFRQKGSSMASWGTFILRVYVCPPYFEMQNVPDFQLINRYK